MGNGTTINITRLMRIKDVTVLLVEMKRNGDMILAVWTPDGVTHLGTVVIMGDRPVTAIRYLGADDAQFTGDQDVPDAIAYLRNAYRLETEK